MFDLFGSSDVENWLSLFADDSGLFDNILTDTVSLVTSVTAFGSAGNELWDTPPHNFKEYIQTHLPKIDARQFAMMLFYEAFTMRVCYEKR